MSHEAIVEDALGKLSVGAPVGFDWMSILERLLALFVDCDLTPEQMESKMKSPPAIVVLRVRAAVRRALVEDYGPGAWYRHNGPDVVQKVLFNARHATADDFKELMAVKL